MLRDFETLMGLFPQFQAGAARVTRPAGLCALERVEPPVLEREFLPGADAAEITTFASEMARPDCAIEVETSWDLWQHDGEDWKLGPASVTLVCSGPDFDDENRDNLRIEFGLESRVSAD